MKDLTDKIIEIIKINRDEINKLREDKDYRHINYNVGEFSILEHQLGKFDDIQISITRRKSGLK